MSNIKKNKNESKSSIGSTLAPYRGSYKSTFLDGGFFNKFFTKFYTFAQLYFFYSADKARRIKKDMKRVADWQTMHFKDAYSNDKSHRPLYGTKGALYVGMVKWAEISDDDTCYKWLKSIGEEHQWQLYDRKYEYKVIVPTNFEAQVVLPNQKEIVKSGEHIFKVR